MPELPDVVLYIEALKLRIVGQRLERLHLLSPFVLRSVDPPIESIHGHTVRDVRRVGKRIVFSFDPSTRSGSPRATSRGDDDVFLVLHLMIAGRLRWREPGAPAAMPARERASATRARHQRAGVGPRADKKMPSPKIILASFEFPTGTLFFTEASSKKRASMQLVQGEGALAALDPGGVEPLDATLEQFHDALTRESHTLKRALTDPHLLSGIGNAYSDEILHAARLSPLKLTRSLSGEEVLQLYDATRATLVAWIDRLRRDLDGRFPEKVTAFREAMAVHGRFRQPCPVCGSPVQRIVYADNECNYCATCQTGGRLLADRSLSRLLKDDWPRRLDDQA